MHDAYEARPKLHSPNASVVPSFPAPKRGKVRGVDLGTWNCIIKDALPGAIWKSVVAKKNDWDTF